MPALITAAKKPDKSAANPTGIPSKQLKRIPRTRKRPIENNQDNAAIPAHSAANGNFFGSYMMK